MFMRASRILSASVLSRVSVKHAQSNRFLSYSYAPKPLKEVYRIPRIKDAMEKEGISEICLTEANPNSWYLERFATHELVYAAYQRNYLTFSDYAFGAEEFQNNILWFLSHFKNTDEVLSKKYISLKRDATHFLPGNFDLFNKKFCHYLLDTQKISIQDYIANQKINELYNLSRLFLVENIDLFIMDNSLSIDELLKLDSLQLKDLTELLAGRGFIDMHNNWTQSKPYWDIQKWLSSHYITLQQFLACEPGDRRRYLCFMYNNSEPCNHFTLQAFLLLKPTTRNFIKFHQKYITPQQFDALDAEPQQSLSTILFSNMGLYALDKNYISVEEFLGLPKNVQLALGQSIFFDRWNDNRGDGIAGEHHIDTIFQNNSLNWSDFSVIAERSIEEAAIFLHNLRYDPFHPAYKR